MLCLFRLYRTAYSICDPHSSDARGYYFVVYIQQRQVRRQSRQVYIGVRAVKEYEDFFYLRDAVYRTVYMLWENVRHFALRCVVKTAEHI